MSQAKAQVTSTDVVAVRQTGDLGSVADDDWDVDAGWKCCGEEREMLNGYMSHWSRVIT